MRLVHVYKNCFSCCRRKSEDDDDIDQYLFVVKPMKTKDESSSKNDLIKNLQSRMKRMEATQDKKFRDLDSFLNKKILGGLQDLGQDNRAKLTNIEQQSTENFEKLKAVLTKRITKMREQINQKDTDAEQKRQSELDQLKMQIIE